MALFCFHWPFQFPFHGRSKTRQAAVALLAAVDEDSGSAVDTDLTGHGDVFLDLAGHLGRLALGVEFFLVQVEAGADLLYFGLAEGVVMFKQGVVKGPELPLGVGRQGGGGRRLGELVVAQREVLKDNFHFLGILLEQLLEDRRKPGAVRSLEIGEDGHRHRRIVRSLGG
jgi:hypothetical protein